MLVSSQSARLSSGKVSANADLGHRRAGNAVQGVVPRLGNFAAPRRVALVNGIAVLAELVRAASAVLVVLFDGDSVEEVAEWGPLPRISLEQVGRRDFGGEGRNAARGVEAVGAQARALHDGDADVLHVVDPAVLPSELHKVEVLDGAAPLVEAAPVDLELAQRGLDLVQHRRAQLRAHDAELLHLVQNERDSLALDDVELLLELQRRLREGRVGELDDGADHLLGRLDVGRRNAAIDQLLPELIDAIEDAGFSVAEHQVVEHVGVEFVGAFCAQEREDVVGFVGVGEEREREHDVLVGGSGWVDLGDTDAVVDVVAHTSDIVVTAGQQGLHQGVVEKDFCGVTKW